MGTVSKCQAVGQQGRLASSMGAFVSWIAGRYEEVHRELHHLALGRCSHGKSSAIHARTPAAVAELRSAWEIFLQFALEANAITLEEKEELGKGAERALAEVAALQARYQQTGDPALSFIGDLRLALATGVAHLADRSGRAPESAKGWGWRWRGAGRRWIPMGTRIGWLVGADVFLDAAASYRVAQKAVGAERLAMSEQTLRRRLHERGLLASIDMGRQMLLVRRTLEGHPRHVLHLNADILSPETEN